MAAAEVVAVVAAVVAVVVVERRTWVVGEICRERRRIRDRGLTRRTPKIPTRCPEREPPIYRRRPGDGSDRRRFFFNTRAGD